MSNLDNLTSKILADAKAQADKIVKDAQEKAQHKYDLEIKKINAKKETVLENARRDRELLSERIKSSANLKARNKKLEAKQAVIDKVIDKLKTKLVNMDEKKYINYLNKNIDKKTFKPLEYEFIKDKKSVYYYNSEIDDFVKLEGADTKTFEVIGNGYAKDRNKIYFYDIFRINKYPIKVFADKNSFTIFENMDAEGFSYAEDKDHIYCNGKILEGADYESFKTSRDERYSINKGTVKDKNHEYLKCTIKTF